MADVELRQPQRRRGRDPTEARATPRELEIHGVDVFEHEPAVELGDPVVVPAFDAIGIRHPDARAVAEAALRAQDVEDRILVAAGRRELLIDRREEADVGAVHVARQLHRRHRLHDTSSVD